VNTHVERYSIPIQMLHRLYREREILSVIRLYIETKFDRRSTMAFAINKKLYERDIFVSPLKPLTTTFYLHNNTSFSSFCTRLAGCLLCSTVKLIQGQKDRLLLHKSVAHLLGGNTKMNDLLRTPARALQDKDPDSDPCHRLSFTPRSPL
jgi:hypothetical protein